MPTDTQESVAGDRGDERAMIDRREAIRRVTALLGGMALVGGGALMTGCRDRSDLGRATTFSADDIAFLDEVADTILPETKTPGAKAAKVGAFMALMVTDTYDPDDQQHFRDGMRKLDEESMKESKLSFMKASPQQRLALLERLDKEQKADADGRGTARKERDAKKAAADSAAGQADKNLPDQRKENAVGGSGSGAAAITKDPPTHYFRMMKELTLLGYFTSEIGYTKAMRYVESPGRFDPCLPYAPGETSWASHA